MLFQLSANFSLQISTHNFTISHVFLLVTVKLRLNTLWLKHLSHVLDDMSV